jgi:hypothetical protein
MPEVHLLRRLWLMPCPSEGISKASLNTRRCLPRATFFVNANQITVRDTACGARGTGFHSKASCALCRVDSGLRPRVYCGSY